MKTILCFVVLMLLLAGANRCEAFLRLAEIRTAKDCPEGLVIKSKVSEGMIEFDVEVDREGITQAGELYAGRVSAYAFLNIGKEKEPVASVTLHGEGKGKKTRYQFRISPAASKDSRLEIGLSLFEKDGMPTIGGGVTMQVHLAGFGAGK